MKKISYLLCVLMLVAAAEVFFSCKYTSHAVKREQANTDRRRDAKAKQAKKDYKAAKRAHLKKQDNVTQKRMKQTVKKQKKQYSRG